MHFALLLAYTHLLIPAPAETEKNFSSRLTASSPSAPTATTQEALEQLHTLYDLYPIGTPLYTEAPSLFPWVIAQTTVSDATTIHIHPRASTDVIAHELVHAARAAFDEPQYEEILAYQTSQSPWRRYWGALFSTLGMQYLYLLSFLPWLLYSCTLFFYPFLFSYYLLTLIPPLFLLALFALRLSIKQRRFRSCLQNLAPLLTSPSLSYAVAVRLTDNEITKFSSISSTAILTYALSQKELRWRSIVNRYFTLDNIHSL